MEPKVIKLTTEKELKIFMDPVRQRLLRTMRILGKPMTTKGLADELGMTPASAKHHLAQLEQIGLIEFDHSEVIHGITARYYRLADVDVSLGMDQNAYLEECEVIAENQVMSVLRSFTERTREFRNREKEKERRSETGTEGRKLSRTESGTESETESETESGTEFPGDCLNGVVYLTKEQQQQVCGWIRGFLQENRLPKEDASPYEFSIIYCEAKSK